MQAPLSRLRLFPQSYPLYINDLLKNILGSFVTIYTDDTRVYGYTSKSLDVWSRVVDLSSDLIHTDHWFVGFNTSRTKVVTFNYHRADPEFSPVLGTHNEFPCLEHLLELKLTPDLK